MVGCDNQMSLKRSLCWRFSLLFAAAGRWWKRQALPSLLRRFPSQAHILERCSGRSSPPVTALLPGHELKWFLRSHSLTRTHAAHLNQSPDNNVSTWPWSKVWAEQTVSLCKADWPRHLWRPQKTTNMPRVSTTHSALLENKRNSLAPTLTESWELSNDLLVCPPKLRTVSSYGILNSVSGLASRRALWKMENILSQGPAQKKRISHKSVLHLLLL